MALMHSAKSATTKKT
eukprot:CCRYP_007572-RC/>CCRYP_007572-RC protein AED:0.44 eAED:1.00 QI:0/-1/0/1/-1/0/1/0/15